jgi:hypothetical protein
MDLFKKLLLELVRFSAVSVPEFHCLPQVKMDSGAFGKGDRTRGRDVGARLFIAARKNGDSGLSSFFQTLLH